MIGTAGWSLPRAEQALFPTTGSHLERYAARFRIAEINSSFHRSHRAATWNRWRESVPAGFQFSVKMPKTITHGLRLEQADELTSAFLEEISLLGATLGFLLVQTPPRLAFDAAVAKSFFDGLRARSTIPIVCEPRHACWFTDEADELLVRYEIARVAADPARVPAAAVPGGWRGLSYYRLHGSPQIYRSSYDAAFIHSLGMRSQQISLRAAPSARFLTTPLLAPRPATRWSSRTLLQIACRFDRDTFGERIIVQAIGTLAADGLSA